MDIFDYLPLYDLLKIAAMSPRCADVISGYAARKLKHVTVTTGEQQSFLLYQNIVGNDIQLSSSSDETFFALKVLGHLVKHIHYEAYSFGNKKIEKLFEYGDKYCSQATKHVVVVSVDEAVTNWTYAFDHKATQVTINRPLYHPVALDQLFPFMEYLIADEVEESLAKHYPRLTKCILRSAYGDHDNPNVYQLIRLNPQLRYFHTSMNYNATYMKHMSEMLPTLETLSITIDCVSEHVFGSESVRFKKVKNFTLHVDFFENIAELHTFIGDIQFDQLESLKLTIHEIGFTGDGLIEIMRRNRGLKKFDTNAKITQKIVDLLGALPELEEIKLHCHENVHDLLDSLLTSNQALNRISLHHCDHLTVGDFEEIDSGEWKLAERYTSYDRFFAFTRIHR